MMKEYESEGLMAQLHKRFADEQVRAIFRNYQDGQLRREEAQELLEISKSQFFYITERIPSQSIDHDH